MTTLYYVHDPMCSWCWGFSRVWQETLAKLPSQIEVVRLLGGLAEDNEDAMPEDMQHKLAETWKRIADRIPGVEFNFDFWKVCAPRRATYPACRAVIAARQQGREYDIAMTQSIQHAYYLQARNPSDESTLTILAEELGLNTEVFRRVLNDPHTQEQLLLEISEARRMGADSFPSLVLEHNGGYWHIPIDYNQSQPMLELIEQLIINNSGNG
jgi:putative protein-disulfide isomerase